MKFGHWVTFFLLVCTAVVPAVLSWDAYVRNAEQQAAAWWAALALIAAALTAGFALSDE